MAAATQNSVYLPPELWVKILKNFDDEEDLPQLWITCRHVNTTLRDIVESIFVKSYLSKTSIRWYLGMSSVLPHPSICSGINLKKGYTYAKDPD